MGGVGGRLKRERIYIHKEGMETHSSILAGKSHGQRNLVGYSPWGYKESYMTEQLSIYIYSYRLICKVVWQKSTQHCKAIILQIKIKQIIEKNESKVDGISFKTSVCFSGNYMGLQEILLSSVCKSLTSAIIHTLNYQEYNKAYF